MSDPKHDRYVYALYAGTDKAPFYIGVGKDGTKGKRRHRRHLAQSRHEKTSAAKNAFLQHCIRSDIPVRSQILADGLTIDEACQQEVALIRQYGRRDIGAGCLYNANDGGFGCKNLASATREKIAAKARQRMADPAARAHLSDLTRKQMQDPENRRRAGGVRSPETLKRMAQAQLGKSHTAESRAKMSAFRRGKPKSPEHRAKIAESNRRTKALRRPPTNRTTANERSVASARGEGATL